MVEVSATKRTFLETLLVVMGWAGLALSIFASLLFIASSFFMPDEPPGLIFGLIFGFLCGVVGVTAGVVLIALSQILTYLRIIAAGTGPGKVFE